MKKKRQLLVLIPLVLTAALSCAYLFLYAAKRDESAPVIQIDNNILEVSVNYSQQDLVKGVSAWDEIEEDVTDKIVVESISSLRKDHTASIVYAAFDANGNVSKASRVIKFIDYTEPHFYLHSPLLFITSNNQDVMSCIGAVDVVDGDISRKIKGNLVSDTSTLSNAGVHRIEFRVSNSLGDTVYLTLPVDVFEPNEMNTSLNLKEYLIYLPKDSEFDPAEYLSSLAIGSSELYLDGSDESVSVYTDSYGKYELTTENGEYIIDVDIDSNVNTNISGVYTVTYRAVMERGTTTYTGFTRLNVVVEEMSHE